MAPCNDARPMLLREQRRSPERPDRSVAAECLNVIFQLVDNLASTAYVQTSESIFRKLSQSCCLIRQRWRVIHRLSQAALPAIDEQY